MILSTWNPYSWKLKTTLFMADVYEDMACVLGEDEFYLWR